MTLLMKNNKIPKIIHYCWFGGKPLPKTAIKCMASWKKFFPEYEIKEWNESNFDVNMMAFTQEAYAAGMYAFVSDVARFVILEKEGGLYFDTDVEVIRPFDDIIERGAFMGIETPCGGREVSPWVNPGLGLGCEPGNIVVTKILDYYKTLHYCNAEGVRNPGTVVTHTSEVLRALGMQNHNHIQQVASVTIYPQDYFNPWNDAIGKLTKTENTRSIHWYAKSWLVNYGPFRTWLMQRIHRLLGIHGLDWLKKY